MDGESAVQTAEDGERKIGWEDGEEGQTEGPMARLWNTNRVFPSRAFALMAPAEARKHSLD